VARQEALHMQQEYFLFFKETYKDRSYECTPNGMISGITLHSNSKVSVAVTTGSWASKVSAANCMVWFYFH